MLSRASRTGAQAGRELAPCPARCEGAGDDHALLAPFDQGIGKGRGDGAVSVASLSDRRVGSSAARPAAVSARVAPRPPIRRRRARAPRGPAGRGEQVDLAGDDALLLTRPVVTSTNDETISGDRDELDVAPTTASTRVPDERDHASAPTGGDRALTTSSRSTAVSRKWLMAWRSATLMADGREFVDEEFGTRHRWGSDRRRGAMRPSSSRTAMSLRDRRGRDTEVMAVEQCLWIRPARGVDIVLDDGTRTAKRRSSLMPALPSGLNPACWHSPA